MILIKLFSVFLRISLFAIGGAHSFLPLIEKETVERYHWLTQEEFLDICGMVKVFPGAISIKYATYTGYKIAGIPGVIFANLGNILAVTLMMIFVSIFYTKYKDLPLIKGAFDTIRLVVFAMMIAVAFQVMDIHNLIQTKNLLLVILSFLIFIYTKIHPAIVIILLGILGAIWR